MEDIGFVFVRRDDKPHDAKIINFETLQDLKKAAKELQKIFNLSEEPEFLYDKG